MSHSERPSRTRLIKTYLSLVGGPALALLVILQFGTLLTSNRGPASSTTAISVAASQTPAAIAATPSPNPDLPLLLTQIVVILEDPRTVLLGAMLLATTVVTVLFPVFPVFLVVRTMMLFSTLTLMPISRMLRRIQRLIIRDRA